MDSHGDAPWRTHGNSRDEPTRHDSGLHGCRDLERRVDSRLDLLGYGDSAQTARRASKPEIGEEPMEDTCADSAASREPTQRRRDSLLAPSRLAPIYREGTMKCSKCQQENPPGSNFCVGCGARLGSACASCGMELSAGSRFCNRCGAPVQAETRASPRFASP